MADANAMKPGAVNADVGSDGAGSCPAAIVHDGPTAAVVNGTGGTVGNFNIKNNAAGSRVEKERAEASDEVGGEIRASLQVKNGSGAVPKVGGKPRYNETGSPVLEGGYAAEMSKEKSARKTLDSDGIHSGPGVNGHGGKAPRSAAAEGHILGPEQGERRPGKPADRSRASGQHGGTADAEMRRKLLRNARGLGRLDSFFLDGRGDGLEDYTFDDVPEYLRDKMGFRRRADAQPQQEPATPNHVSTEKVETPEVNAANITAAKAKSMYIAPLASKVVVKVPVQYYGIPPSQIMWTAPKSGPSAPLLMFEPETGLLPLMGHWDSSVRRGGYIGVPYTGRIPACAAAFDGKWAVPVLHRF